MKYEQILSNNCGILSMEIKEGDNYIIAYARGADGGKTIS